MPTQQFDLKLPIHPRQDSQDFFGKMSNSSTHNNSHTPNRKSMIMYQKADMNDFSKGISDMTVAYVPYFGHDTIHYDDKVNSWKELSKNILNIQAPKHSAILELVHQQKLREDELNLKQNSLIQQKDQSKQTTALKMPRKSINDTPSLQQSYRKLQKSNTRMHLINLEGDNKSGAQIENEILQRLKWWRLGSKGEEEHGFRRLQSNFSIQLNDLRLMRNQTKLLLNEHQNSFNYFKGFNPSNQSHSQTQQQNKNSQTSSTDKTPPCTTALQSKMQSNNNSKIFIQVNRSPIKIHRLGKESITNKVQKQQIFLQKLKLQGKEKRKYFDSFLPSPRIQQQRTSQYSYDSNSPSFKIERNLPSIEIKQSRNSMNRVFSVQNLKKTGFKDYPPSQKISFNTQFDFNKGIIPIEQKETQDGTTTAITLTQPSQLLKDSNINQISRIFSPQASQKSVSLTYSKFRTVKDIQNIYDSELKLINIRKQTMHQQRVNLEQKLKQNLKNRSIKLQIKNVQMLKTQNQVNNMTNTHQSESTIFDQANN